MASEEIEAKARAFVSAVKDLIGAATSDSVTQSSMGTYYEEKALHEAVVEMLTLTEKKDG